MLRELNFVFKVKACMNPARDPPGFTSEDTSHIAERRITPIAIPPRASPSTQQERTTGRLKPTTPKKSAIFKGKGKGKRKTRRRRRT